MVTQKTTQPPSRLRRRSSISSKCPRSANPARPPCPTDAVSAACGPGCVRCTLHRVGAGVAGAGASHQRKHPSRRRQGGAVHSGNEHGGAEAPCHASRLPAPGARSSACLPTPTLREAGAPNKPFLACAVFFATTQVVDAANPAVRFASGSGVFQKIGSVRSFG